MVKAHIVPESFYPPRDKGKQKMTLASSDPKYRAKQVPTGIYDPDLVCQNCERRFDPWDNYAANLLLKDGTRWREWRDGAVLQGYTVENFDYARLKLFALSILWRAGASSRDEFKAVDLGPYLGELSGALVSADPGSPDFFSVFWVRYDSVAGGGLETMWISPMSTRFDGIRFYCFIFGGFEMYLKVDRRTAPLRIRDLQISPNTPLIMVANSFRESKGFAAVKETVARNAKGRGVQKKSE